MTGIEEGVLPRREEAPPREGAVTGDVPGDVSPRSEGDAPLGREGASRQPERERVEEEEPRRREGTDRPERR